MSVTLLKITAGYTFTGIAAKGGYEIQEEQPVVISESIASSGFARRKLGTNKVTTIVVTFACTTATETAANLAALVSSTGQKSFDYFSPLYNAMRRATFNIYVDPVKAISVGEIKVYDAWKVTLEQATVAAAATPITTTVSAYPSSYTSATWSNPTHAYADDSSYAWTHGTKDTNDDIVLSGFSLPAIPEGAVIEAVTVEMNYRVSNTSSAATVSMQALHGATAMGTGWASTAEPTSWTKVSTAANGLWTVAQLNDGTFAVRVRVLRTGTSATPYYGLDYVKISVTYTVQE